MTGITLLYFVDFILVTLGIIFTLIPFLVKKNLNKKKEICTYKVVAKIVNIEKRRRDQYIIGIETVPRISAFNCYEYEYNMEKVKAWSNVGNMPGKFQIGQQVTLYCNPNNPTEFYSEEESAKIVVTVLKLVGIGILVLGASFIAITILLK